MLTIQSKDRAALKATKYTLLIGLLFIVSQFIFKKHFLTSLIVFAVTEAVLFIRLYSVERTRTLKIQGKRLDIEYGNSFSAKWQLYQLSELNGQLDTDKPVFGKPYFTLRIFSKTQLVSIADTRDGFELDRLKTLSLLLRPLVN